MTEELFHFVDGERHKGTSGRFGDVFNPATGEVTKQVPLASADEVREAIASASAALPGWSATPVAKRAQVLFKFRELIIKNMDELADLVSTEHGKTLDDAKGSITRGLEVVEFACGIPHLLKGEYSESVANGVDVMSMRQPVGVCAGITPFNFPAMVPMWMFPVALATGNTFILKPSERDPSCGIRLAELMFEAGAPNGVLNVINGDKEAVDVLLSDPEVGAISFVGSTAIGRYIYETGCANGKRVQALCGAKNHMVIMPDADMDQAADAAMGAAYGSAGERCMAISVAVAVGDEAADAFVQRMAPKVHSLKMGAYNDPEAEMGPVVTAEAKARIEGYIDQGVVSGAELVVDGRGVSLQGYENGFFVGGSLFDKVTTEMSIYKDEIFGPVLCVVRAENYEEAKKMVMDHEYGNGAAIFTRDGDTARDFAQDVNIGMVGVNVPIPVPVAYHSFGGWKASLFGDHSVHGMEGVRFYTKLKTVTSRWPSGIKEGAVFNFHSGSDT
ncbi:MAG: CoA-acylating methylmalonate-semialdehyde dehydrogenase [Rhodospirillales bacterium]|jgi:malonate-semialdehyde dehydrogenase (acetylating)/methylmalonate-semialdehyde dehydrogenase|tara:strand:+ start:2314 stop:3819 length:1506 start_codon:yes stop_codon:yes gene_type:complete